MTIQHIRTEFLGQLQQQAGPLSGQLEQLYEIRANVPGLRGYEHIAFEIAADADGVHPGPLDAIVTAKLWVRTSNNIAVSAHRAAPHWTKTSVAGDHAVWDVNLRSLPLEQGLNDPSMPIIVWLVSQSSASGKLANVRISANDRFFAEYTG